MTEERWYVVRGVFGKAQALHRVLSERGVRTFYPMLRRKDMVEVRLVPAIPNLCFVYGTRSFVLDIIDHLENEAQLCRYLVPYIDMSTRQMVSVSDAEMQRFQRAFQQIGAEAVWLDPSRLHLSAGDYVRVTGGYLKGLEGYITRCKGQQRVVVTLGGVAAIGTIYIPTPLVERISPPADLRA